ncbi:MAG: outer membrane beta-barrel protein [Aureibaculum sp.]
MKKLLILIILFFSYAIAQAQIDINYGITTGINYNSNGDLSITGTIAGLDEKITGKKDVGYHIGLYTQFNLPKLYIRPELFFKRTKNTYNHILSPSSEFKLSTLELPVLVGFKIIKPINFYIGPSLQYIIDNDFSSNFDLSIDKELILEFNIGLGVQLDKFGIDLRYKTGFSENLAIYIDNIPADGVGYSIDSKSDQLVLSFSYQLN